MRLPNLRHTPPPAPCSIPTQLQLIRACTLNLKIPTDCALFPQHTLLTSSRPITHTIKQLLHTDTVSHLAFFTRETPPCGTHLKPRLGGESPQRPRPDAQARPKIPSIVNNRGSSPVRPRLTPPQAPHLNAYLTVVPLCIYAFSNRP
jgi:hypothetical protein